MGYDGSGNFSRAQDFTDDRDNGIAIRADRMDSEFDNFATGMNAVFLRNGVAALTGDLNMGANRIIALASGLVASPGIRFSVDANTGLYLPATGRVALTAAGVNRLEANTTGVVATGTFSVSGASTLASLGVTGNATVGGTLGVTGAATVGGTLAAGVTTLTGTLTIIGGSVQLDNNNYVRGKTSAGTQTRFAGISDTNVAWFGSIDASVSSIALVSNAVIWAQLSSSGLTLATDLAITEGGTGASTAANARTNLGVVPGTDVQTQNANLTAFAGLTLIADRLPYANGSGTLTLATFTAFGRTLAALANASAGRTALGVVPGTDVQTQNANLTAFAGLSLIADRLPYANGSGTLALATFTAFGRTLAALADAAAGRTALGLIIGTDVAPIASPTFTGTPAAPTAAYGTNTTQLATTAFVDRLRNVPVAGSMGERAAVSVITAGATLNTGMAEGDIFSIYNETAGNLTITAGGGLTLRLAGTATTGNRTLAQRSMATVWARSTTEYIMSGPGVS